MNMLSSSRLALRKRMRRTKGFMERRFLKFLHDAKRGKPGKYDVIKVRFVKPWQKWLDDL